MGNKPVSMVDPDGGYINQSSAEQAARAQFLNQQAYDRSAQRGRYSYDFLYNNYKNAVEDLYRDHFYSINKDFNDYSFLEDLYKLNNEYMGLGLGNMYMSSGMDYVSQNTLYSDYGRSLMWDLTAQNGTAATMAGIAASIPGPDQWTLASPADRLKIGLENGIYKSYTLVGAYRKKQQVGERDNAENGETDDFITGYEFHYETDDGKEFKSYITAKSDMEIYGRTQGNGGGNDWGTITIVSNLNGGKEWDSGHSWIELTKNGGETITMSIYGNRLQEFNYNLEKGMKKEVFRTQKISLNQYNKAIGYATSKYNNNWNAWHNCVDFSVGMWNNVTGENLKPETNNFNISTPFFLQSAINTWNINFPPYSSNNIKP